jgi:hypothetical protein
MEQLDLLSRNFFSIQRSSAYSYSLGQQTNKPETPDTYYSILNFALKNIAGFEDCSEDFLGCVLQQWPERTLGDHEKWALHHGNQVYFGNYGYIHHVIWRDRVRIGWAYSSIADGTLRSTSVAQGFRQVPVKGITDSCAPVRTELAFKVELLIRIIKILCTGQYEI